MAEKHGVTRARMLELLKLKMDSNNEVQITTRALGAELGKNYSSVNHAAKKLVEEGLLEVRTGFRATPTIYKVLQPTPKKKRFVLKKSK